MEARNRFTSFLLAYHPGTVRDLPVLSPYARAFLNAGARRMYSENEIVKAFETDPFLSAKLFGVANSIFFNLEHRTVYTVRDAIDRVGFDYAVNLAHEAPYFAAECDLDQLIECWAHCIGVAHCAKSLSKRSSIPLNSDNVFLIALIHDIGYLLEIHYDPSRLSLVAKQIREKEDYASSQSHVILGESLADFWSLPASAKEVVRWHHTPDKCPSENGRVLATLIYLAEELVRSHLAAQQIDTALCANHLSVTGLTAEHLHAVGAELKESWDNWTHSGQKIIR